MNYSNFVFKKTLIMALKVITLPLLMLCVNVNAQTLLSLKMRRERMSKDSVFRATELEALKYSCLEGIRFGLDIETNNAKPVKAKSLTEESNLIKKTMQRNEDNGFCWMLVEQNNFYGAETIDGKLIIPTKYGRIDYVGNLGYRDYFVVDDAKLYGEKTGFSGLKNYYQGIYTSDGVCIIPTDRGYSGIWGFKSEDSNKLYYSFEICINGVEINGICDIHGKELYSISNLQDKASDGIRYNDYDGFYYYNKNGTKEKLGIKIPNSDINFITYTDNYKAEDINRRIANTDKSWIEKNGILKKIHIESDGFKWYEVKDKQNYQWAENIYGDVLISPKQHCPIHYYNSTIIGGIFVRSLLFDFCQEAITKEGNILIPSSRKYQSISITNPNNKYITIQGVDGVGIADLNGYEVASPIYDELFYDGYDVDAKTKNGSHVKFSVHKKPTREQNNLIYAHGGYYSNMPWLLMPGPSYIPTYDIWATPLSQWDDLTFYGSMGDYKATNSSESLETLSTSNSSSTGKCSYCNGKGKKIVDQSNMTFGSNDPLVYCNECGKSFHRSTGHSHVFCGHCGGTGKSR